MLEDEKDNAEGLEKKILRGIPPGVIFSKYPTRVILALSTGLGNDGEVHERLQRQVNASADFGKIQLILEGFRGASRCRGA